MRRNCRAPSTISPRPRSITTTPSAPDSLQRDTIAVEDAKGPYANLIATRAEDKDKPWVRKLVKAYQSEEVRRFIESEFKGSLVPAF